MSREEEPHLRQKWKNCKYSKKGSLKSLILGFSTIVLFPVQEQVWAEAGRVPDPECHLSTDVWGVSRHYHASPALSSSYLAGGQRLPALPLLFSRERGDLADDFQPVSKNIQIFLEGSRHVVLRESLLQGIIRNYGNVGWTWLSSCPWSVIRALAGTGFLGIILWRHMSPFLLRLYYYSLALCLQEANLRAFIQGFFGYTRYFNGPILFFYRVPKNILHKSWELIYEKGYFREKNVLKCCFQLKYLISLLDIDVIDLDRILEHCKILVFLYL
jgi:hypothetical protein